MSQIPTFICLGLSTLQPQPANLNGMACALDCHHFCPKACLCNSEAMMSQLSEGSAPAVLAVIHLRPCQLVSRTRGTLWYQAGACPANRPRLMSLFEVPQVCSSPASPLRLPFRCWRETTPPTLCCLAALFLGESAPTRITVSSAFPPAAAAGCSALGRVGSVARNHRRRTNMGSSAASRHSSSSRMLLGPYLNMITL